MKDQEFQVDQEDQGVQAHWLRPDKRSMKIRILLKSFSTSHSRPEQTLTLVGSVGSGSWQGGTWWSWRPGWAWRTRAPIISKPWCPGWALGARGPHDGLSLWTLDGKRQRLKALSCVDAAAPEIQSRRSPANPASQRLLVGLVRLRIVGHNTRRRALPSRP